MANETRLGASFSIDVSELTAGLNKANKMIRESESEFKAAASGMDDWQNSAEGIEARLDHLTKTTDLQREKVRALKEQYEKLASEGIDETSDKMIKLRTQINNEQASLSKNEKEIKNQKKALEDLGDESKNAEKETKDLTNVTQKLGDGFSVAKGAIAGFIANGLTAIVGSAKNAVSSLIGLTESTLEYRTELAKLTTVADQVGASGDYIIDKWMDLSNVLGDEGAVTEGLNNLMSAGFTTTEQLDEITKHLEGAAIKWKDTLKFEGLADGLQETLATGKAIGPFAELLERAGVNLEEFDAGLAEATTQAEKQQYILDQLSKLGLKDVSDAYRESNKDLIEYNQSIKDLQQAQAELGEVMQPLVTDFKAASADILYSLVDMVKGVEGSSDRIVKQVSSLLNNIISKVMQFTPTILEMVGSILMQLTEIFIAELPNLIQTIVRVITENVPHLITMAQNVIMTLANTLVEQIPLITQSAIDIFLAFVNGIADMLPELIPIAIEAVLLLAKTIADNYGAVLDAGINLLESLVTGIINALPRIVEEAPKIIKTLVETLINKSGDILSAGIKLTLELANGLIAAVPQLVVQLPFIIAEIVKGLITDGVPALIKAGGDLLAGLFKGMLSPKVIWENIKAVGNNILDGIKGFFGIHSPSKLFEEEVGRYLGQGMALGIGDGFDEKINGVNKAIVKSMSDNPINIPVNTLQGSSKAINANGGVVVNQYNTYSQAHSRYELFKSKQATAAAVRLAIGGAK